MISTDDFVFIPHQTTTKIGNGERNTRYTWASEDYFIQCQAGKYYFIQCWRDSFYLVANH